jgi:CrcB protein
MENFAKILSVAAGGAFGAAARYLINISPLQNMFQPFPFPTFFINVLGSFLLGFLFILLTGRPAVGENFRLAVTVGFLGAFTTFSTFELEIWTLIKENQYLTAFVYLFLSVAVGFCGVLAGIKLAKQF